MVVAQADLEDAALDAFMEGALTDANDWTA